MKEEGRSTQTQELLIQDDDEEEEDDAAHENCLFAVF
jgi:hypothetical protein